MKILLRVIAALFALAFVVTACSNGSGSEWTFAPDDTEPSEPPVATSAPDVTAEPVASEAPTATNEPSATDEPAATDEPSATEEPATDEPAASEAPSATEEPAATGAPIAPPDEEARVIELESDATIRFMQDGVQIRELAVTPGETVIFRVDNTAGFPHNFYIGSDEELRVMGGTTDVGIPDWDTGVQELEWVVPDDLTDVRFACTVPGHYYTMQGDFVIAP